MAALRRRDALFRGTVGNPLNKDAGISQKILVVEDNAKNRKLVVDLLGYYGYEAIEAEDGKEAIRMARDYLPALIIMDIQMPVMDGISAAKVLRGDPATKDIKMIALTSFAMKGDKERFLEAGFDAYIAKPIDTRQFPKILKKYVDAR